MFSNISDRKRKKSEIPTMKFCHASIKRWQKEMKSREEVLITFSVLLKPTPSIPMAKRGDHSSS